MGPGYFRFWVLCFVTPRCYGIHMPTNHSPMTAAEVAAEVAELRSQAADARTNARSCKAGDNPDHYAARMWFASARELDQMANTMEGNAR